MSEKKKENIALELRQIAKNYKLSDGSVLKVLTDINLSLLDGELVALVAPSGAGKSTLMHIAGLLDKPSSGKILIKGNEIQSLPDRLIDVVRGKAVGFVYQSHFLIPELTALENVAIPQRIVNIEKEEALNHAYDLLKSVGLEKRATFSPSQLSGGEKQRVAIARALANSPSVILADEPTGNLDPKTADNVFAVFKEQIKAKKKAGLIVTHNFDLAKRTDKIIYLLDGKISKK